MDLDQLVYKFDWDNEDCSLYHRKKRTNWMHSVEEYLMNDNVHIYKCSVSHIHSLKLKTMLRSKEN